MHEDDTVFSRKDDTVSYRTRIWRVSFLTADDSGEPEHEVKEVIITDVQDRLGETLDPTQITVTLESDSHDDQKG